MNRPDPVIETGVPFPKGWGLTETLRSLDVGQSVLVPKRRVDWYIKAAKLGTDKYFASRTMTTGVRIWRLE